MNYTLNQLRIFLKVSETLSVTRAAEALHLTQPAVSIQLKNFQDQFDIPLTEVIGRQIYITDFGKEVAEMAERILQQVQEIDQKSAAYRGELVGKLKISVVSTAKYVMPYFLTDFIAEHPSVDLVMDVTNKSRVIESLEKNEVDFSLVSILPEKLEVDHLDLIRNKLFLVGRGDDFDYSHEHNVKLFEKLTLIYREKGSGTRQTMSKFIDQYNVPVTKRLELTSNEAVKQALIAGMGYSIMPLIGIKNELLNGDLHIVPVKGLPIETAWSLIWLKKKKHSPVAQAYLDYILREKQSISERRFRWYEKY